MKSIIAGAFIGSGFAFMILQPFCGTHNAVMYSLAGAGASVFIVSAIAYWTK